MSYIAHDIPAAVRMADVNDAEAIHADGNWPSDADWPVRTVVFSLA